MTQDDVELQVVLAALSLGPVGLADQLEGFPDLPTPSANVATNVTLAMSLTAANGRLLQPSFPLTPLGHQLGNVQATADSRAADASNATLPPPPSSPSSSNAWGTYTAVHGGDAGSGRGLLFWTAVSFSWVGQDQDHWPADSRRALAQSELVSSSLTWGYIAGH